MPLGRTAAQLALGSLAVALVALGLKLLAWRLTGSLALWSDAIESLVNVAASLAALVAIRLADKPADREHPYGHHKAEYFSAVLEGVLIILAAASIAVAAWEALGAPRLPDYSVLGLSINGLASVLNGVWAWLLIRRGRGDGLAGAGCGRPASGDGRRLLGRRAGRAWDSCWRPAGRCSTRCWRCWSPSTSSGPAGCWCELRSVA